MRVTILFSALAVIQVQGFAPYSSSSSRVSVTKAKSVNDDITSSEDGSRREFFTSSTSAALGLMGLVATTVSAPEEAFASGGATAGRYTTIPIAKRRYYGRVQQAVHEYLALGPAFIKGDMNDPTIQLFFDVNGVVVVPAKKKDINGVCTKKNNECKGTEIRDSRNNDMKASMYLLGNAFRINQTKAPDNLPTVKAARAFFKELEALEKCIKVKKPKTFDKEAIKHYLAGLEILDTYLDLVELPPPDSGHYDKEFDTLVGVSARIT